MSANTIDQAQVLYFIIIKFSFLKMTINLLLVSIVGALLASSGEMLVGASAARANEVYYAPPENGNGSTTTADGDQPNPVVFNIKIPGGVSIKDFSSGKESYHFKLGMPRAQGAFKIKYTMWLTLDEMEIPNTRKRWDSPLVVPRPGDGDTAESVTEIELRKLWSTMV